MLTLILCGANGLFAKESGWKFSIDWPTGEWKKYSPYTLYYLSIIVISQDLYTCFLNQVTRWTKATFVLQMIGWHGQNWA